MPAGDDHVVNKVHFDGVGRAEFIDVIALKFLEDVVVLEREDDDFAGHAVAEGVAAGTGIALGSFGPAAVLAGWGLLLAGGIVCDVVRVAGMRHRNTSAGRFATERGRMSVALRDGRRLKSRYDRPSAISAPVPGQTR